MYFLGIKDLYFDKNSILMDLMDDKGHSFGLLIDDAWLDTIKDDSQPFIKENFLNWIKTRITQSWLLYSTAEIDDIDFEVTDDDFGKIIEKCNLIIFESLQRRICFGEEPGTITSKIGYKQIDLKDKWRINV